jgi:polysaccharide chain length determinant protein (PEP-CTERM system associated)
MTMVQDFEEQEAGGFDLQHYFDVARRRYLHFLIPLFVGWLLVWVASWVLPARYKSGTLILVEQPSMPRDYVLPNVNDDLQERLQSITQQILSRTRLLHIIDQLNLYSGNHMQLTPDEKAESMRKDIEIELVRDASNRVTAFNVYYSAHDPYVAQQVTSELTSLFINENLELRQQMSEDTTKFIEDQLETAHKNLAEQEEKIREFKGQHVGELPTQVGSNLQILSGLQSQLQTEQDGLNTAKQQRVYLETLVNQYRTLQGTAKTPESAPLGLPALDRELERLKAQLADLSAHYTDKHPDVRKVKEQIAKTEALRTQLLADLKSKGPAHESDVSSGAATPASDPAQMSAMTQLQGQLQANQIEIANREHSIESLKGRVNEYQNRLNQEPVREQQIADLTRGYDQSKANYDDLLKKKNQSEMATSMELLQQGERFRIIDPPSLPLKPDFPNRMKFCGIGLGVGMALGLIVAGVFETLDDRVHHEKELKDLLPPRILCEIPVIINSADVRRNKLRARLGWTTGILAVAVIVVGSAISYLRG